MRLVRQHCIVHTNKIPQTRCHKHPACCDVALEAGYLNSTGVTHPSEALWHQISDKASLIPRCMTYVAIHGLLLLSVAPGIVTGTAMGQLSFLGAACIIFISSDLLIVWCCSHAKARLKFWASFSASCCQTHLVPCLDLTLTSCHCSSSSRSARCAPCFECYSGSAWQLLWCWQSLLPGRLAAG